MGLPNGHYRTAAGSQMWISGEHGGRSAVEFDWLEEGACPDCVPEAYEYDGCLRWHCDQCGGGHAALMLVMPKVRRAGNAEHETKEAQTKQMDGPV